jgi:hypothetical protein
MNAPGKGILKVVSILFIVFGAIALVFSIIAVAGSFLLGGLFILAALFSLAVSVLELVLGIVGLKKCGDPAQGGFFVTTGIILCVISLISLIIGIVSSGFNFFGLIGFVLPILYIVGGSMNKKAVA